MRRAALLLAALLAAPGAARAWRLFGEPSDGKVRPVQELNDAGKPRAVLAALTPEFLQTLRGTDLRQAYILMGDSHDKLGKPDQAISDYQLGVTLFPKNVDLLSRQGMLLHREGLDQQARPLLLRVLAIEPNHGLAHQGLAEIDRKLGFLDRSASHYEIALEAADKRADLWRDYAEVLLAMRDDRTADLALRRALQLDPKNPEAHVLFAFARRARNDYPAALSALDDAAALGAGEGAQRAKALFLLEAGRLDEAAAQAELVLRAVPGDGAALWVLGRVKLARGDDEGAIHVLEGVKAADGGNAFAAQAAKTLVLEARLHESRQEEERYRK
ncbi:MAG: tetratricopeptide repeat protein [Elusimicrobia bacterium]|nr:tetratricopeptide repeat protein [Elusimicrobiota bacterium]